MRMAAEGAAAVGRRSSAPCRPSAVSRAVQLMLKRYGGKALVEESTRGVPDLGSLLSTPISGIKPQKLHGYPR